MKTELLTALQPAFAKISDMGIRYSALPGHTLELSEALNEQLSSRWRDLRGIEIVSFGVSSVKANEEDEQMIKEMQRNAAFMDPSRPRHGLYGHGDGRTDGGHERPESLSDGGAAAGSAYSAPCSRACRSQRLDLCLRAERHHRQLLP